MVNARPQQPRLLAMPNRTPVRFAKRVEVYNAAFKIALAQIPPLQLRERPDIALRIHASIRRQLKEGQIDARTIAFTALRDVLVPDAP
jgi:hypothetical protein